MNKTQANKILEFRGIKGKFLDVKDKVFIYSAKEPDPIDGITRPANDNRYFCVASFVNKEYLIGFHDTGIGVDVEIEIFLESKPESFEYDPSESFESEFPDYDDSEMKFPIYDSGNITAFEKGVIVVDEVLTKHRRYFRDLTEKNNLVFRHTSDDNKGHIYIPRSLTEIISDFDTDIEGIEPVDLDEDSENYFLDQASQEIRKGMAPENSPDQRENVFSLFSATELMAVRYVVRMLKALKASFDKHSIHYKSSEDIQASVDSVVEQIRKGGYNFEAFYFKSPFKDGLDKMSDNRI